MPSTDWVFQTTQAVLDAAASCGAECGRRLVIPWGWQVPGGCVGDDCTCTLTASGLGGYFRPEGTTDACYLERRLKVELVLDVCAPKVESDGAFDAAKMQAKARDIATLQEQIASGLLAWKSQGRLCPDAPCAAGCGGNWTPTPWEPVGTIGSCLRYRMLWSWREAIS